MSKKILIICPYWLGDGILATGVINYYRKKYRNYLLIFVGPKLVLDLYEGVKAPIKLIEYQKAKSFRYWFGLYKKFRGENFFRIICFRQSVLIYLAQIINPKIKTLPFTLGRITHKKHILDMHAKLIDNKYDKKNLDLKVYSKVALKKISKANYQLVILNPNASYYAKMWPSERFIELIKKVLNDKAMKNIKFGIIGTDHDTMAKKIYQKVSKFSDGRVYNLIGKYDILATNELIKKSKAVITNDTSILHLAAINNVSLIAMYGPTNHHRYNPKGYNNKSNIITLGFNESYLKFRKKLSNGVEVCNNKNLMRHISVLEVYESLVDLLNLKDRQKDKN